MSFLSKTIKGVIRKPVLMCFSGPSGVGKTTFAASAPKPFFLATEEGTNEFNLARLPIKTWEEMEGTLTELAETKTDYETIVIDTVDRLETLIHKKVAEDVEKESIEEIGFGRGYVYAEEYWNLFFLKVKEIRDKQNKNIILIAQSDTKKKTDVFFNEDYDRYELKLHKRASNLIKETVDVLTFCMRDIAFKKDKSQSKARAFDMGKRIIYTEDHVAFDAKNRYGLPPKIFFPKEGGWDIFKDALNKAQGESPESLLRQLNEKLKMVSDKEIREKAKLSIEENKTDLNALIICRNRVDEILKGENNV